jgi:hypothetical protein
MRKLNTLDLLKCATILGKMSNKVVIDETMNKVQVGMTFFSTAMSHAETDIKELMASIAEMTVEEFEKQPITFPLDVIEYLIDEEDMQLFLQRVSNLAKKVSKKPSTK